MAMWSSKAEITSLLIDGANAHESCKAARVRIDYAKLLKFFRPQHAIYFTALPKSDRVNDPNSLFKLMDYLDYNGYKVNSKPVKVFRNNGIDVMKGNMDVEIALEIVRSARWANHIVLFSGDGDFRSVVEYVQNQGVRVTVLSALRTNPPMIADELRRQANTFMDICDPRVREHLEMTEATFTGG